MDPDDYLPCIYCLAFCKNNDMWNHSKSCHWKPEIDSVKYQPGKSSITKSRMLLEGGPQKMNEGEAAAVKSLREIVLCMMRKYIVPKAIWNDRILVHFGSVLLRRLGPERKNDTAQRMRLVWLKLILTGGLPNLQFSDYLTTWQVQSSNWCSGRTCWFDGEWQWYLCVGSLTVRIGNNLKCGQMKRGVALKNMTFRKRKPKNSWLFTIQAGLTTYLYPQSLNRSLH